MKKILIDCDEVICDSGFLNLLNDYLKSNYTIDDFTSYFIEEDVLESEEEKVSFYDYIKDKNPYTKAVLYEGAYETIKALNEKYDVYICSSCAIDIHGLKEASGQFFKNKYDFLIKHFPFLNVNKFVFTGVKNIFNADVQIDDKFSHLQSENIPCKLLFTSYHNKMLTEEELKQKNVVRVNSWADIAKILL
mgnify:FL=1